MLLQTREWGKVYIDENHLGWRAGISTLCHTSLCHLACLIEYMFSSTVWEKNPNEVGFFSPRYGQATPAAFPAGGQGPWNLKCKNTIPPRPADLLGALGIQPGRQVPGRALPLNLRACVSQPQSRSCKMTAKLNFFPTPTPFQCYSTRKSDYCIIEYIFSCYLYMLLSTVVLQTCRNPKRIRFKRRLEMCSYE